jgi:predicted metalloenzyme YecM
MHDSTHAKVETDVATRMENIIGDYRAFFADLLQRINRIGIDVAGCPISHLAYRTETFPEYEQVRERIRRFCIADLENVWNGRPIDKLLLKEPLALDEQAQVSLIELIPPPHQRDYPMGLEHCGIVIGERFAEFSEKHSAVLTGRQNQGPYCQPVYITFDNNRSVKFYRYSLKDVVEQEGRDFVACAGQQ